MSKLYLKTVDSTQVYLKKNLDKFNNEDVVYTFNQTNGYGVTGTWDGQNKNIYYSQILFLKDLKTIEEKNLWVYILVAVYQTCQKYNEDIKIKIPNDIYYKKQKISGFLIEKVNKKFIVGIGINVFEETTEQRTGLANISTSQINIETIVDDLISNIKKNIELDYKEIYKLFVEGTNIINKEIMYLNNNKLKKGIVKKLEDRKIIFEDITYYFEEIKFLI